MASAGGEHRERNASRAGGGAARRRGGAGRGGAARRPALDPRGRAVRRDRHRTDRHPSSRARSRRCCERIPGSVRRLAGARSAPLRDARRRRAEPRRSRRSPAWTLYMRGEYAAAALAFRNESAGMPRAVRLYDLAAAEYMARPGRPRDGGPARGATARAAQPPRRDALEYASRASTSSCAARDPAGRSPPKSCWRGGCILLWIAALLFIVLPAAAAAFWRVRAAALGRGRRGGCVRASRTARCRARCWSAGRACAPRPTGSPRSAGTRAGIQRGAADRPLRRLVADRDVRRRAGLGSRRHPRRDPRVRLRRWLQPPPAASPYCRTPSRTRSRPAKSSSAPPRW